MTHERLAKGLTLLFLAAATMFTACGSEDPPSAEEKYCNLRCDCNGCSEAERATCVDDKINQKDEATDGNCDEEYSTLLTCLLGDAACTDGDYDESSCFTEETDLNSCLNPAPTCNLTNNGTCNEPPPKGDGLCAAGSDTMDCSVPTCPSAGDGYCDEPEGSGLCAEGSDPLDCPVETCSYAGDGYCDEPEGSGLCAEGTDPLDCPAETCQACYDYALSPSLSTLCTSSESLYGSYFDCGCAVGSQCLVYCDATMCAGESVDSACDSCIAEFCSTAYTNCHAD